MLMATHSTMQPAGVCAVPLSMSACTKIMLLHAQHPCQSVYDNHLSRKPLADVYRAMVHASAYKDDARMHAETHVQVFEWPNPRRCAIVARATTSALTLNLCRLPVVLLWCLLHLSAPVNMTNIVFCTYPRSHGDGVIAF